MDRYFVIPDIHGQSDKLREALALVRHHGGDDASIVFLGDYVDRGPDSAGVLQILADGVMSGRPWTVLRGNHDDLMLKAFAALPGLPPKRRGEMRWFDDNISGETLESYGVTRNDPSHVILSAVPEVHLDLIRNARLWFATDHLLFVHAGIWPGVPMALQSARDLMWIREPFLSDKTDHGKLVVHGHSPVDWPEHHGNRVALDGGAGWGRTLHVALFEGPRCWLLHGEKRTELTP
jgi:serine/threonine protein phosphatase 1